MRHAIVHVGPHKTGSTYLQFCFQYHRDALAARGFVVPAVWEHAPGNPSHTGVVRALDDDAAASRARAVLEQTLMPAGETLLISAEDLVRPKMERLLRLKALLDGLDVRIVYYVRRWSDLLPSAWQEDVKQGKIAGFESFYLEHVRNPHASQIYNLDVQLAPLAAVFGQERVHIVCYTVLRERQIDLFRHFAESFLQWPHPPLPPGNHEINASRSEAFIELLRILNDMEFGNSGKGSAALRNRLDAAAAELNLSRVLDWLEARMARTLCNDAFPDLQSLHRQLHAKFLAQIVPPALPDGFFRPARREVNFVRDNSMASPSIASEVHRIFDALTLR